jgi:hypothetical protein
MPGLFNCQNSSRSASNGWRKKVIQTPSLIINNNNNNNNKSISPYVILGNCSGTRYKSCCKKNIY